MQPANVEFVVETGKQIASLSAFLGGFAATFLGILLQSPNPRRYVGWAAGAAAVASAAFILAVIAGTALALVLHPGAPPNMARPTFLPQVRTLILVTFASGIYAILLSLGLSGWIRSRQLGIVTSAAALISALIVSLFVRW
jgi:sterol desaturase/sphingolipid hydroxylase (fatty acid hydroxylase superfamily)